MTIKIDEFRAYLKINKHSLDDELVQQPSLFFAVSEAYVQASAERDALKERLALVDAELDTEIRLRLDKDDERVTEAKVKSRIQTHSKHEAAFAAYIKAKGQADTLTALKESFQQRNYMLKELCGLFVANYFEAQSVQGTDRTDTARYQMQRVRLAEKRGARGQ